MDPESSGCRRTRKDWPDCALGRYVSCARNDIHSLLVKTFPEKLTLLNSLSDAMAESSDGVNATTAAKASSSAAANYAARRKAETDALANNDWIGQYLTDNLDAPPKEEYAEFIEAYTDITERAQKIAREKEEKKRDKRVKQQQNRLATIDKFVTDVTALIDEPFRGKAMEGNSSYLSYRTFVTPFVEDLLKPFLKSVSSIKKNTPTQLANQINTLFRGLEPLLEMGFLSDDDAFETAAKAFFLESFPNVEAFFETGHYYSSNGLDSEFSDLMKDGQFFKALYALKNYDLSPVLLATEPSASLAQSAAYLGESSLKRLAQRSWRKHWEFLKKEAFDSAKNTQAFEESHNYVGGVLAKLDSYSTWLEEREAAKSEEELRIWSAAGKRKSMLNEILNGYSSRSFSYFMEQTDFELMYMYQTNAEFRYDEMRKGLVQEV